MFKTTIKMCLQYETELRVDINTLLSLRMFDIARKENSSVMRHRTISKSQPRKIIKKYENKEKAPAKWIRPMAQQTFTSPYVNAFSKPIDNVAIHIRKGFLAFLLIRLLEI